MIALWTSDWRSTAPWASRGRVRVPRKWALARPLGRTAEEERRSLEGGRDMRSGAIIQETFHEYWFDQADRRRHFCRQRSEDRRGGKEGVSKCRSRWSPYQKKK